jgi:DNA-directed RNA polymerase subunit RPC12/RpoP
MSGELGNSDKTRAAHGMLTRICVACGAKVDESLNATRHQCQDCGSSFRDRPPTTYARMEGFLEFERSHSVRPKAPLERTLEARTFERWLAFSFWTLVILLGLLAIIRT